VIDHDGRAPKLAYCRRHFCLKRFLKSEFAY